MGPAIKCQTLFHDTAKRTTEKKVELEETMITDMVERK